MPEGPEVRLASDYINHICCNVIFSGQIVKSDVSKNPSITFAAPFYTITGQSRGKELLLTLKEADANNGNSEEMNHRVKKECDSRLEMRILFGFGMSGSFSVTDSDNIPKHSHLRFYAHNKSSMVLNFVDPRRFGTWRVTNNWSPNRGPDAAFEYELFCNNIASHLNASLFNKPICEVLLDQKYFNGIGNYLRAEILYRAGIPPFTMARNVFDPSTSQSKNKSKKNNSKPKQETKMSNAVKIEGGIENNKVLSLCRDLQLELIGLRAESWHGSFDEEATARFGSWLQCYCKPEMKNLVDNIGRTIWFLVVCPLIDKKSRMTGSRKKKSDDVKEDLPKNQAKGKRGTDKKSGTKGKKKEDITPIKKPRKRIKVEDPDFQESSKNSEPKGISKGSTRVLRSRKNSSKKGNT
ncbi:uncharacterized protein TRIADDRAFT_54344 [Trichoplax adhaerens]|uniref:DNA-(apurinic or apyrimidinic site) lyase n=1 Tax=Trichoplax adhaerens TaxID=10228 RepID=B3RRS2_TRIAD|nr:hypothetical protein TRIADDRAFT_54344 [Trichoplax adhaerens]EDV26401.1 hypothetical protein TRIADDRAFT_54344 [Trichoplax adhaerens]|eukprot:XP_002110397.1 hypothetical protein TRIADDRAFT_54344 [Trichoplax adhaerens]